MSIEMVAVTSTNISAIGWDAVTSKLHVRFTNKRHYSYAAVTKATFDAFLKATSKGAYFSKYIRGKFKRTLERD